MLYSCKPLFERIKAEVVGKIDRLPFEIDAPRVAIIQCGKDEPSSRYIRNKLRDFAEVGILADVIRYPASCEIGDVCTKMMEIENCGAYCGIIVQRPVLVSDESPRDAAQWVADYMPAEMDIDNVVPGSGFMPPSVRGLNILLKEWDIDPAGKSAIVIGRGDVGRPVARYLLGMDATVTVAHSKTPRSDLYAALKTADIVVGAAGLKSPLYPDLHSDAVVIDYGIRPGAGGKLHGDIADAEGSYCKYKTAVPGGMGLMVRAGLLLNIVDAMERWANAKK